MIKKLIIKNFRGIEEKSYLIPDDKPFFLFGENGFGKTSTLDALRFALTGKMPADMIFHGASEGYVGIVFDDADNTYIERRFYAADKPNKVKMNGKNCTAKAAQTVICDLLGCPIDKLQTVTSHEIFLELINGDLGEFLRAFIFEKLERDTLYSMVEFSEEELKKLNTILPKEFEVSFIDEVYNLLFAERAEHKKTVATLSAKYDFTSEYDEPYYKDEESLKADEEKYLVAKATSAKYASEKRTYDRALLEYNNRCTVLETLKRELAKYGSVEVVEEAEITKKESELYRIQTELRTANSAKVALETSLLQQKEILSALDSDRCPISDCLVCKTDKSCIKADIKDTVEKSIAGIEDFRTVIASLGASEISTKNEISELRRKLKTYTEYLNLKKRVDEFIVGTAPIAPTAVTFDETEIEIFEFRKAEFEQWSEREAGRTLYESKVKELNLCSELVNKFKAKGIVPNAVMQHYCDIFDESAEALADMFGYKINFVADNGVKLLVKPKELKQTVEFSSLSRGEQLTVSVIIYTVLNLLMGTGIMVIDNFNDLDTEAAVKAYKIICAIKEELGINDIFVAGCFDKK